MDGWNIGLLGCFNRCRLRWDGSIIVHLVGFRRQQKKCLQVGWVEERNPTTDIGMLNPTYESAVANVIAKSDFYALTKKE